MEAYPPGRKPLRFTIGALLLLTAACAWLTCAGRLISRSIEERGATAQPANAAFGETVCILRVPETARNVDFEAHFQSGMASFDVSEAKFLAWANQHSWQLSEINLSGKVPACWELDHLHPDWPADVRRVWYYSNMSHRGGWTVMYDRDRGRGYVKFAPR